MKGSNRVLSGRKVLITGGTGFLGRGILRRRAKDNLSWDITVYSRDEYKQDLCKRKYPDVKYVLGDIRDREHLELAMQNHDIVIHTAAIKYIPEAETNVAECVDINVEGSRNVFAAARRANVTSVIAISTDKVSQPVNVYGATKMVMERLLGEQSHYDGPFYAAVRYGNVVGSTGSVIPMFQHQMKTQGFITVTDPTMTRYFITVDDAIDLILSCFTMASGSVRIPAPAAMKLQDLALSIAGSEDNIKYIGKRPGERQHEMMLSRDESTRLMYVDGTYKPPFELCRIGTSPMGQPFQMTSDMPARWLTAEEMQEAVEDAANV